MGRFWYESLLKAAKSKYQYQTLSLDVLKSVYPYTSDKFAWSDEPPAITPGWYMDDYCCDNHTLLWYTVCSTSSEISYLVDISYGDARKFKRFMERYAVSAERRGESLAVQRNATMAILEDAQRVLEAELTASHNIIQQEAAKQKEIAQRLSPFEHDYIKSQIEVEV